MAALQLGPVAISVSASWSSYESGIFDDVEGCGTTIDHGVVAVGYGSERGKDYWIVRNSWGAGWGEGGKFSAFNMVTITQLTNTLTLGYIRLARNNGKDCGVDRNPATGTLCKPYPKEQKVCGICGLLSDSSYPTGGHLVH